MRLSKSDVWLRPIRKRALLNTKDWRLDTKRGVKNVFVETTHQPAQSSMTDWISESPLVYLNQESNKCCPHVTHCEM